jgi:toxin ParE1/3/4
LLDFPFAGASRERLAHGLRVTFKGNYAIYYAVTAAEVIIVRVLHGARDAAVIAEHGGFNSMIGAPPPFVSKAELGPFRPPPRLASPPVQNLL